MKPFPVGVEFRVRLRGLPQYDELVTTARGDPHPDLHPTALTECLSLPSCLIGKTRNVITKPLVIGCGVTLNPCVPGSVFPERHKKPAEIR